MILALLAGSIIRISSADLHLIRNLNGAIEAELAANGAARRALHEIAAGPPGAWRTDGAVYGWRSGPAQVRVSVTDELGRIDINHASADVLARLFDAAGARQPETLAGAVEAFRKERRAAAAGAAPAGILGELRGNLPFASPDDLQNVAGIDPALMQRLHDSITVYTGRALPVLAVAPPLVRRAMKAADVSISAAATPRPEVSTREQTAIPTLLGVSQGQAARGSGLYRVHAEALTTGGSHFTREAVVAQGTRRHDPRPELRLWRRGERLLFPPFP